MQHNFQDLSIQAQEYFNNRFCYYGISGEDGYNILLPDQAKELTSDELIELLSQKDISHIIPQSYAPEISHDIDNIFLEDSSINRARGAEISTEDEISLAWDDQIDDVEIIKGNYDSWDELGDNLSLIDNSIVDEIIGGSLSIGILLSGFETKKALDKREITLNEVPEYFTIKTGTRTIKLVIIGFSLTSSSPIIVSGGVAYIVYKNKDIIRKVFTGIYSIINNDKTKHAIEIAVNNTIFGLNHAGNYTYSILTNDKNKKAAKTIINKSEQLLAKATDYGIKGGKKLAQESLEIIKNENNKKLLKQGITKTNNIIKSASKVGSDLFSWIDKDI